MQLWQLCGKLSQALAMNPVSTGFASTHKHSRSQEIVAYFQGIKVIMKIGEKGEPANARLHTHSTQMRGIY